MRRPTATIVEGSFTGDGPVDAIFRAINAATGIDARLREFRSARSPAARTRSARSSVVLELGGQTASGQGVATDILEAAARAYVRALSNVVRRARAAEQEPDRAADAELTPTP